MDYDRIAVYDSLEFTGDKDFGIDLKRDAEGETRAADIVLRVYGSYGVGGLFIDSLLDLRLEAPRKGYRGKRKA